MDPYKKLIQETPDSLKKTKILEDFSLYLHCIKQAVKTKGIDSITNQNSLPLIYWMIPHTLIIVKLVKYVLFFLTLHFKHFWWFQVSSSVSESDVFRSSLSHGSKSSDADNSWDINDPDIPARIDQYVSFVII